MIDAARGDPMEEFEEHLRDALLHLYDPGRLQGHPLQRFAPAAQVAVAPRGKALRQELLDAIEALRPGAGVPATSRAWRLYQILELRYVDGQDVAPVIEQTALSKSQYHREHQRALQALACVLSEKWFVVLPPPQQMRDGRRTANPDQLARNEVQRLQHEHGSDVIDVGDVARGIARLVAAVAQQHDVELRLAFPDDLPKLRGDRVALRHALLTLLMPALHRTQGGVLEMHSHSGNGQVTVDLLCPAEVGPVPEADLAESRPFVEALGGHLEPAVTDGPSGPWRVRLQFPADDHPVLLVVDNNADFVRLIERYLAGQPWQILSATDAEQALSLATRRRPAAILLDVVIPGRDGWELLQDLRTAPETRVIPVAICSVLNEPDVAIGLGASTYLRKPISQLQLLAWLDSSRAATGKGVIGAAPGVPPRTR
ncbi:MAG TPA: response regulator [Chloroflexota bacterium]|nr:response regulator [Chloroflexota bacterium]